MAPWNDIEDWVHGPGRTLMIQQGYEGTYHVTVSSGDRFGIATSSNLPEAIREAILDCNRQICGAI